MRIEIVLVALIASVFLSGCVQSQEEKRKQWYAQFHARERAAKEEDRKYAEIVRQKVEAQKKALLEESRKDYPVVKEVLMQCAAPDTTGSFPTHYIRMRTKEDVQLVVGDCFRRKVSTRYEGFKSEIVEEVTGELYPRYVSRDKEVARIVERKWAEDAARQKREQAAAQKRAYDNSIKSLVE